jgi:hypothetical protein
MGVGPVAIASVLILGATACGSSSKVATSTASSNPSTPAAASTAPSSVAPSSTAAEPAAPVSTGTVLAHISVSGAETLTLTSTSVKCAKTVEADGSAEVDVTIMTPPQDSTRWEMTVTTSADSAGTFDSAVTYDLAARNGLASIAFLDASGSQGAGWSDGYTSGIQQPGSLVLSAGKSGTIDSALNAYDNGTQAPIHIKADWTCGP